MFDNFDYTNFKNMPPPKDGSLRSLSEIRDLNNIPIDKDFVKKRDNIYGSFKEVADKNNITLDKKEIKDLTEGSASVIMKLKKYYNRPRPKQIADLLDYNIKVIETKTHHTPAYPSGHTIYAAMAAYLFSDMYPHRSSEFFKMISIAGLARCLQGVHYPSDNEASMVISGAIWQDVRYKLFPNLQPYRS